jgi:hypothetical protein
MNPKGDGAEKHTEIVTRLSIEIAVLKEALEASNLKLRLLESRIHPVYRNVDLKAPPPVTRPSQPDR